MNPSSSLDVFVQEFAANATWQQELKALDPSSPDSLAGWLANKGCTFTAEELYAKLEAATQESGSELSDESLGEINGGSFGGAVVATLNNMKNAFTSFFAPSGDSNKPKPLSLAKSSQ